MGGSQNQGYHFGGPRNKEYNILGSILGSPILGNYHMSEASHLGCQVLRGPWNSSSGAASDSEVQSPCRAGVRSFGNVGCPR